MCVGIPRKIIEISNPGVNLAIIEVNGVKHEINISYLVDTDHPVESCVGDWALVYMGLAMNRITKDEANKTLDLLREMGEIQLTMDASLKGEVQLTMDTTLKDKSN